MGLLDDVKGQVGAALGGSSSPLLAEVGKLFTSQDMGGLQGLVDRFRKNGLGEIVDSWVSQGKNLSISPDQVQQALGNEQVQKIASAAGIDVQAASAKLAELLPQIVDKATPDGKIQVGSVLEKGLSYLQGLQAKT
jgi:uncharacterized protein YidB (DUF937 family)